MGRSLTRTISTVPITGTGLVQVDGLDQHMLLGIMLAENGNPGAAARVLLRNGSGGSIYMDIRLATGESMEESYSLNNYYWFSSGIYLDVISGTVRGSIRCRRSVGTV